MFPAREVNPSACFHCGLPAEGTRLYQSELLGATRTFCCAGCEAVASTIVGAGFGAYYETRDPPRGAAQRAPLPQDVLPASIYDEPVAQRQFVTSIGENERETLLLVERISCAACVWLIERHLRALPGVLQADVNGGTHRAVVRWDARRTRLGTILQAIRSIGYDAAPFDPQRTPQRENETRRAALWRLFVSGFASMQVMMYAFPAYLDEGATLSASAGSMMRWASLLLTAPVILFACGPFFGPAWRELRGGRIGLDAPISLGILAGFAASAWATVSGEGEVYFDSIAMLVFLLLAARGAEAAVRKRAARSLDPLLRWMPSFALRVRDPSATGKTEKISAHELVPGDLTLVPPGERFPADGRVVHGLSSADESLLTGESLPVAKSPGAAAIAGSVNLEQPLVVRVERAGSETRAAGILRMVERAVASRPAILASADRVGQVLTWVVIACAAAAFVAWLQFAPEQALWVAVAVLVVSCPCALGLAAPIALSASTGRLLARGIVLTRARALEALANTTDVVLDKTGTLTRGRLRIVRVLAQHGTAAECLGLAASLEAGSRHPIAGAFAAQGLAQSAPAVSEVTHFPGKGIEARVAGRRVRIGSEPFCRDLVGAAARLRASARGARTTVFLADEARWLAAFILEDELREHAPAFVAGLRERGVRMHLVSGDGRETVAALARMLGIDHFSAAAGPQDKVAYVDRLQQAGRVVVMIGDGLNDAPVLAHADASIAMGSGASAAQLNSDFVLLASDIGAALETFALSRRTMRIIRQNFAWAIAYNALAIPAAAFGWIGPWEAAIGMAASSLIVALNSLRLTARRKPDTGSWKASSFSFPSPSRSYS